MDVLVFNYYLKNLKKSSNSLERLYEFYYCRIIYHLGRVYGYELAKDVAQEFFINLLSISEKQGFVTNPTAWVYACCENIAKRKVQYESRYVLNDENQQQSVFKSEAELYGDLYDVIKQLDDQSQKILKLFYWEGYNLKEIAQILGIKPATIRQKHSRAIKKMKKALNDVTKSQ